MGHPGKPLEWKHDDWIVANFSRYPRMTELVKAYNKEFGTDIAYKTVTNHIRKKLHLQTRFYFTEEQDEWLRENYGCNYKELTERFNEKFGTNYEWGRNIYSPVERHCKRLGYSRYNTKYGYTPEEDEWLKEYAPRFSSNWLSKNIVSVSGHKHSPDSIKIHVREWLDIHKGNGGVREDTVQTYKHDVGTISMHGDQKMIKLKDTGDDRQDWYSYVRYLYETYHNVKLPKNYQVIRLDGNPENDSIDNLVAVNHREHAILSANKWHKKGEITRAGVECARLSILLKDACCKTV